MKNKTAYFGVFTSLALILSYVETLIPISFGIPGIKLGLANLVIVIVLYTYGGKEAFLLSVTRILLSGFLFGNLSMILYSMAGGVFSLAIMVLLRKTGGFIQLADRRRKRIFVLGMDHVNNRFRPG